MSSTLLLETRPGPRPDTTKRLPHSQLNQHGPKNIILKLHAWAFSLKGVENQDSLISVPGSRALVMHSGVECNEHAFMVGREFAHIHPHPDYGSMHLMLPAEDAQEVADKGWGEDHYLVTRGQFSKGLVLVFSPRDERELATVKTIVKRSYDWTVGHSVK
ncbi:MAG: hypothetical protein AAF098_15125 [Pseudomonadota bacterium]